MALARASAETGAPAQRGPAAGQQRGPAGLLLAYVIRPGRLLVPCRHVPAW